MKIKFKTIKSGGNSFIKRLSVYLKNYSIKVHLILDDDKDEPHTHPWDFKSLLLIPYKEFVVWNTPGPELYSNPLKWSYYGMTTHWRMFDIVNRKHNEKHAVSLYRIWGKKIPALTIGIYSKKLQLCSFCKELSYCKEKGEK